MISPRIQGAIQNEDKTVILDVGEILPDVAPWVGSWKTLKSGDIPCAWW